MEKKFQRSLFLFRRDLRLEDNTGLIFALQSSKEVIPAFIFTPEQIEENPLRNDHCLKFMTECLEDLENQLEEKRGRLFFFKGKPEEIVDRCMRELSIDALIVNRDYTPYSQQRDEKLQAICKKGDIPFYSFDDALLHPPEDTLKKDGKPYMVFTPYFRNTLKLDVLPPVKNRGTNYFCGTIAFSKGKSAFPKLSVENELVGGRSEALKILKNLSSFSQYASLRDFPAEKHSTRLSPYLKFTVCSPREVYAAISQDLNLYHDLIRSLYWRDFFTSIAFLFPNVFKGSFHSKFDNLTWSDNQKAYQQWCEGVTGFPIVDAGMREMNKTGFMHNRVRMIVASFLVKDLHINWRWGEEYFARCLIDYDPAVNNGNWQWSASTGCDAQPYFRIFNPWNQQKKFDPECIYIKKWIPELREFSSKAIHEWYKEQYRDGYTKYPAPMTDHATASKEALRRYKCIKSLTQGDFR